MNPGDPNKFEAFFKDDHYLTLKNHLYNYLLRKRAVEKAILMERPGLILEVGSGVSPVATKTDRIVYTDLSVTAMRTLKEMRPGSRCVVADGTRLPFKAEVFTHTVCSEVLEHLADDRTAIKELARVTELSGHLIITFPHRQFYFGNDDSFVGHVRRYELTGMVGHLREVGFQPILIEKILGPLEKVTMSFAVFCFSLVQSLRPKGRKREASKAILFLLPLFKWLNRWYTCLAWLDARLIPRAFSTVLLVKAQKQERR